MKALNSIGEVRANGKRGLADALGVMETSFDDDDVVRLLDEAYSEAGAHVVGITGPPGVGKSTLTNELIKQWRKLDQTVGVIAVDPSSQISGGALLGDRTRMLTDPEDQGVFIRSFASRGQLGGLSELTFPALIMMRALYDKVIVETVGVGQSEAEIGGYADTVVLCVQPGSGDSLQYMKSGIMEIPDIVVVTKSDMGQVAERTFADLKGALSLQQSDATGADVPVLQISASENTGICELIEVLDQRFQSLCSANELINLRYDQAKRWVKSSIRDSYGVNGVKFASASIDSGENGPFKLRQTIKKALESRFKG